jgi:hypothetical protein
MSLPALTAKILTIVSVPQLLFTGLYWSEQDFTGEEGNRASRKT